MTADTPPPNLVTDGAVSNLTDGTGVSKLLGSKVVKDIVADFLLSAPVALVAVGVGALDGAIAAPAVVGIALGDALIRVLYRAGLRWAQTPA